MCALAGETLHIRAQAQLGALQLELEESFAPGEVTCLFGPSGSGKSSAMRIIAGLHTRFDGVIQLGTKVWHKRKQRRVSPEARRIGYVPQVPVLLPHLTVRGNLKFVARRSGTLGTVTETIVADTGIEQLLDHRPETLSGGERQRVALAQALLRAPKLLLLDEPLSALDHLAKQKLVALLRGRVGAANIPVLLVSHDADEVAALADRVLWIDRGRIVDEGPFPDGQGGEAQPIEGKVAMVRDGMSLVRAGDLSFWVKGRSAAGARARALISEQAIVLVKGAPPESGAIGQGQGILRGVAPVDEVRGSLRVEIETGEILLAARIDAGRLKELSLNIGDPVGYIVTSVAPMHG